MTAVIAMAPSSESSSGSRSRRGGGLLTATDTDDTDPTPISSPHHLSSEKKTIETTKKTKKYKSLSRNRSSVNSLTTLKIWAWIMTIFESVCLKLDRIFTQWGVYDFLLRKEEGDDDNECFSWLGSNTTSSITRRRKTKKKSKKKNDNSSITKDLDRRKAQRIESIIEQMQAHQHNQEQQHHGIIVNACNVNIWEVRELALTQGGLQTDSYRQALWPYLVGITSSPSLSDHHRVEANNAVSSIKSSKNITNTNHASDDEDVESTHVLSNILNVPQQDQENERHIDACIDLIRRDAGRSVVFRYTVSVEEEMMLGASDGGCGGDINNRDTRTVSSVLSAAPSYAQKRLVQVLEGVIRDGKKKSDNTSLHYYQGLHDIAGVILHTLDYDVPLAKQVLSQVCKTHLKDATRENFGNVTWMLKTFLPPLIQHIDFQAYQIIVEYAQVDLATVCLPWVITWFTHDLHDPDTASRLVDIFISSHPILPMYMCAAIITHPTFQNEILQADYNDPAAMFLLIKRMPLALRHLENPEDPDGDADIAALGQNTTIGQSNAQDENNHTSRCTVPLQEVLEDALAIMRRYQPRSLVDLIDGNADMNVPRHEVNASVSKIASFRPTVGMMLASSSGDKGIATVDEIIYLSNGRYSNSCVRAKLASGVPVWMNDVCESSLLTSLEWGSEKGQRLNSGGKKISPSKQKTKLHKLVRKIFGKKAKKTKKC